MAAPAGSPACGRRHTAQAACTAPCTRTLRSACVQSGVFTCKSRLHAIARCTRAAPSACVQSGVRACDRGSILTRMSVPKFDAFIAIDWSGAANNYDGIAVAICSNGRTSPKLVAPRGRRWTRMEIAEWLESRLNSSDRLLIGFDFAFGFPFESEHGYLGGKAPGIDNIFALWSLIEEKSCGDADFGCNRFIHDSNYSPLFWTSGPRPKLWIERKRRTEHACAETTTTRPDTLYKLLHSKQVGKASITGMRVLHDVRSRHSNVVAIWPFEKARRSAMVEIYPTLFRKIARGSVAKIRSHSALNTALACIDSLPISAKAAGEFTDHETDALLSAAGMRSIAHNRLVWQPSELASPQVQREGWIFGVC